MLLVSLLGCLPLPTPDFRRPASLVVLEGGDSAGLTAKVCTWSTRNSPLDGCANLTDGVVAVDGIGVPEWSVFPLMLTTESPLWGDAFVACEGTKPRGATIRLPDLQVKWDDTVKIALDQPPTHWGAPPGRDLPDATIDELAAKMCAGTAKVLAE